MSPICVPVIYDDFGVACEVATRVVCRGRRPTIEDEAESARLLLFTIWLILSDEMISVCIVLCIVIYRDAVEKSIAHIILIGNKNKRESCDCHG